MAGLKCTGMSPQGIKDDIKKQSMSVAYDIAQRVAPAITAKARASYDSGVNVYGDERKKSVTGGALSLRATGSTYRDLRFRVAGSVMWCDLGTPYARYLIGRYDILPNGGRSTSAPVDWQRTIQSISDEVLGRALGARPL